MESDVSTNYTLPATFITEVSPKQLAQVEITTSVDKQKKWKILETLLANGEKMRRLYTACFVRDGLNGVYQSYIELYFLLLHTP
jgi:hypothetical protein